MVKKKQISSLLFAVRFKVLGNILGQLLLIFAALTTVPLLFSLLNREFRFALPYAATTIISAAAGLLLQRIRPANNVQNNEILVVSALIFLLVPLITVIPFHQAGLSLSDAFFEAVSGFTTTGLTTLATVENLPRTILFTRAWLQWMGGLGIVVLSVALLLPQSKAALHLFKENWEKDGIIAGTRTYARMIIKVYLVLTLAGFLLLLALGVGWFDSLAHVLAAVSTGGFSTFDNSIAGLNDRYAQGAVILLSALGAVPFAVYYLAVRKKWHVFTKNEEIFGLLAMAVIAATATAAILLAAEEFSLSRSLADGVLLGLSAQTTTGFSTLQVAGLSPGAKFILMPFMLIGGNAGSTAGGFKILRLLILLKMIRMLLIRRGISPSAVTHVRFMGRNLEDSEIENAFLLIILFIIVIVLSWLPFILMGYSPLDSLFEVVSATCTVGLSTGISSASLPVLLKSILCADMLMGRLEIIAFLVFIYPATWVGKKRGG